MVRSETISVLSRVDPTSTADLHIAFEQRDTETGMVNRWVMIDRATWRELGEPTLVTVTVEPGDLLSEE